MFCCCCFRGVEVLVVFRVLFVHALQSWFVWVDDGLNEEDVWVLCAL
jgi:hypothetical protein